VIVRFVDIGEIVDNHWLNFLFITTHKKTMNTSKLDLKV